MLNDGSPVSFSLMEVMVSHLQDERGAEKVFADDALLDLCREKGAQKPRTFLDFAATKHVQSREPTLGLSLFYMAA